jgi:chemotaxis signal transduction protein
VSGFVTFVTGGRELAASLGQVREVVRAVGIQSLADARPPVSGLLVLRGAPYAVVDLRDDPASGDVLVLADTESAAGVAVDQVLAVMQEDELPRDDGPMPPGLPGYVLEVRRSAADVPVLLVDLPRLAGLSQ